MAARSQSSLSAILGLAGTPYGTPLVTPQSVQYPNPTDDIDSARFTDFSDNRNEASYGTVKIKHIVHNSYPPTTYSLDTSRYLAPNVSPLQLSPRNSIESLIGISPRNSFDTSNLVSRETNPYSRTPKHKPSESSIRQNTSDYIYNQYQKRKRMPRHKRIAYLVVKQKGASYVTHKNTNT